MTFDIVDKPTGEVDKHRALIDALAALPPGKSIRVPLNSFKNQPGAYLKTDLRIGRKLHFRRLPDGIYLWLDPAPATNGAAQ